MGTRGRRGHGPRAPKSFGAQRAVVQNLGTLHLQGWMGPRWDKLITPPFGLGHIRLVCACGAGGGSKQGHQIPQEVSCAVQNIFSAMNMTWGVGWGAGWIM